MVNVNCGATALATAAEKDSNRIVNNDPRFNDPRSP